MSYYDDVRDFHRKFDLPAHPEAPPQFLAPDVLQYRLGFLLEELNEFTLAMEQRDLAEAADALADLVYVALGTAHLMRLPFEQVWQEIQRANLAKERVTGATDPRSKRRHALDVVKPPGWRAPDHSLALLRAAARHDPGGCRHPVEHRRPWDRNVFICGVCELGVVSYAASKVSGAS